MNLLQTNLVLMTSLLSHCRGSVTRLLPLPRRQVSQVRMVRLLGQQEAVNLDLELFDSYKFSVVQLMELAGLACAHAVARQYPASTAGARPVLVVAGPGYYLLICRYSINNE